MLLSLFLSSSKGKGTVGSEVSTAVGRWPSGTFARPPQGVAVRLNDLFMPRRMEFKGWVTDYKQCRYQGPTDTEVLNLINDLHKMVLDAVQKNNDWEQTRNEQGTWPTKVMVSLWFSNEANLLTRIGLLDVMREELKKGPYKQKGQVVSPRLKSEKETTSEDPCFVLSRSRGDERGHVQDSLGSATAAKYTLEGEGLAGEGWDIKSEVIAGICTQFSEPLFGPLSTRSDEWVGFPVLFLTART